MRSTVSMALIALALSLSLSLAGEARAAQRHWQTATVVNIESQMLQAGYERRFYHVDPGGDLIYVAYEQGWAQSANAYAKVLSFGMAPKKKSFADLTVNDPVRVAIEGQRLFLLDEKNKETRLELYNKIRKATSTAAAAAAVPQASASPSATPESVAPLAATDGGTAAVTPGEIRRGMTTAEVERALGKPLRTVTFESRTQWLYARLVVVFEQDRVSDVSF
jgi:hypothetical protein